MNKSVLFVLKAVDFIDNLGISLLSGVAKAKGWNTHLMVFEKKKSELVFNSLKPDIVCYSSMTAESNVYLEINRYLKKKYDFVSIMGGSHPTFSPEVINDPDLDFICRGEGERAFAEFLEKFERGEHLNDIPNFTTKEKENPFCNLIQNLDEIPLPDRSLIFDATELGQSRIKTFMISRGCPYPCSYCHNKGLKNLYKGKGKFVRTHSVDRAIAEIEAVRSKYPLNFIKFQDDFFGRDLSWLEEFSKLYKKNIGLRFNCLMRLEYITEERLKLLKEANCASISLAIDSANERIREQIIERNMRMSNEEIIKQCRLINSYGIHTMAAFIAGIPTSRIEDEMEAVDLAIKAKITFCGVCILTPYPGTSIYDYCKNNNCLDDDIDNTELWRSIQNRSLLSCFSEKEKDTQWNLSMLWPIVARIPILKPFLYSICCNVKPNKLFTFLFIMTKAYVFNRYIYPCRMPVVDKLKLLIKAMKIEGGRILGLKEKIT